MDEHDLMEIVRAAVEQLATCGVRQDFDLIGVDVFATPGEGASFGVRHEGASFIVTITQIGE